MSPQVRLDQLVQQWEERRREGRSATVEELCQDCPELAEDLRRQIAAVESHPGAFDSTAVQETCAFAPAGPGLGNPADLADPAPLPRPSSEAEIALHPDWEPVPGYRLLKPLGRGGFGEVWMALGPGGFPVAMKFIRLGADAEVVETRSLELMKQIRHANFLATFGAWQVPHYLIVAMELADKTLFDRFREVVNQGLPGIPRDELLEYMHEAAKGIDFLNEPRHIFKDKEPVGIQHRDIKPQNLLLVGGSIKVADFGLAKLLEGSNTRNTGNMTPAYATPEFIQGLTSNSSDQYSLAVTYCHLRGGRLPFDGNAAQVITGHVLHQPDLTMLPEPERPLVAQALSKNPEDRWPNCKTFIRALMDCYRLPPPPAVEPERPPAPPPPLEPVPSCSDSTESIHLELPPTGEGSATSAAAMAAAAPERAAAREPALPVGELHCLQGHTARLLKVTLSPDGQQVWSADALGTVCRWAVKNGKLLQRWDKGMGATVCLAFSADGRLAAGSGYGDKLLHIWDLHTQREVSRIGPHRAPVWCVALSANSRWILTGGEDTLVRLWDLQTGKKLRRFAGHTDVIRSLAMSPRNHRALSGGGTLSFRGGQLRLIDAALRLWDVKTTQELRRLEGHKSWINAVAFSPDGRRLLSASADHTLRLWDAATGKEVRCLLGHRKAVLSATYSPDGRRILSGGGDLERQDGKLVPADCTVRLWDVESGRELHCFEGHSGKVTSVALSADGRLAVSAGEDRTIRLWGLPA